MQQRYADSGQTLLIELQNYEKQGISIWLEGFPSSSVEVSEVMCVREDTNYMRDYVFRQGALSQVRFDKITKKQDFSNTGKTCKTGKNAHVTIKQWTFWVLYRTRGGKSKAFIKSGSERLHRLFFSCILIAKTL